MGKNYRVFSLSISLLVGLFSGGFELHEICSNSLAFFLWGEVGRLYCKTGSSSKWTIALQSLFSWRVSFYFSFFLSFMENTLGIFHNNYAFPLPARAKRESFLTLCKILVGFMKVTFTKTWCCSLKLKSLEFLILMLVYTEASAIRWRYHLSIPTIL